MNKPKYSECLYKDVDFSKIKKDAKEVVFTLISCMCNNTSYLKFKKNERGEFMVLLYNDYTHLALSNLQMEKGYLDNLLWNADDNNWQEVLRIIRTGTSAVYGIRSR
jgi:hypothetical protein